MFFRRSIFFVLLVLLLLGGLFGLRQQPDFERGYSEGYAAALQANPAETGQPAAESSGSEASRAQPARPTPYWPGWGWGTFTILGIFGVFFKFLLTLMVLGFFMKMLGFGRYHRWYRGHGRRWDEGATEKQPEDVEPDIRHA
jgi:hypothetical protein